MMKSILLAEDFWEKIEGRLFFGAQKRKEKEIYTIRNFPTTFKFTVEFDSDEEAVDFIFKIFPISVINNEPPTYILDWW